MKHDDNALIDSVGNLQLDLPDLEVGFPEGIFSPEEIDPFIRNISTYLLSNGLVIETGHTVDGPRGTRFRATLLEHGLSDPPRDVLRFLPTGVRIPDVFLAV